MDPRLRETAQWNPYSDDVWIRYDFAYTDPASRRGVQIGVDTLTKSYDITELDERIVPMARATIVRMLKRKCGVKLAVENEIHLALPPIANTRYV